MFNRPLNGCMDYSRFYVLFTCVSVISGRCVKVLMGPRLRLKRFPPQAELEPGTARSVG